MKRSFVILMCLFLLCACEKQPQIDRIMENGVEVVLNHVQPYVIGQNSGISVRNQAFSIDTEKEEILKLGLTDIETFDVDPDGNIFIIQWQSKEHFIFKFSPEGRFVKSFVRFGQGPGELEYGGRILITPQNEILAKDPSKRKFALYDRDGHFIKDIRQEKNYSPVPLRNGKYFVFWGEGDPEWRKQFVGLADSDFKDVNVLDAFQYPNAMNVKCPVNRHMLLYAVAQDNIYIGNTERGYEIRVFDLEGRLLRKIRKEYKPVRVVEDIRTAYFKMFPEDDPVKNNFYFTDEWPPFRGLYADDQGRLFALTYEPGLKTGEFMYDIFDSEGIFAGRLSLGNMKNLARQDSYKIDVRNRRLYGLREKDTGYKELAVFDIAREP